MLFDQHNQAACVDKNTDDCQNDDDHIVPLNSIRAFHVRSSRLLIHSWRLSNDEVFFRRRRRPTSKSGDALGGLGLETWGEELGYTRKLRGEERAIKTN